MPVKVCYADGTVEDFPSATHAAVRGQWMELTKRNPLTEQEHSVAIRNANDVRGRGNIREQRAEGDRLREKSHLTAKIDFGRVFKRQGRSSSRPAPRGTSVQHLRRVPTKCSL
jgi:hypothetical protein